MATSTDLTRLHASEMAAGLRSGAFSAREIADAHLARIEATDAPLHAWVHIDADEARQQADAADAAIQAARRGDEEAFETLPALLGIPVALKDLVLTRGQPSTVGSRILAGWKSP